MAANIWNEYLRAVGVKLFHRMPKTVALTIAISYAIRVTGEEPEWSEVAGMLIEEWRTLHENGIIKQPPPKTVPRDEER